MINSCGPVTDRLATRLRTLGYVARQFANDNSLLYRQCAFGLTVQAGQVVTLLAKPAFRLSSCVMPLMATSLKNQRVRLIFLGSTGKLESPDERGFLAGRKGPGTGIVNRPFGY